MAIVSDVPVNFQSFGFALKCRWIVNFDSAHIRMDHRIGFPRVPQKPPSGKPRCRRAKTRRHRTARSNRPSNFFGSAADGLDVRQFAFGIHATDERRPRLAHGRLKFRAVQQPLIHAPGQRIRVKPRAAGFLERITFRDRAGSRATVRPAAGRTEFFPPCP